VKIPPSPPPFEKVLTFLKKNLFLFANAVLALLLFGFLLYSFDFTSLYSELIRSNTVLLLLAALCYLLTHFISALRYKLLLPSHSVFSFFSSHMKAMLASDATPGRVGYSLFILELRKKGARKIKRSLCKIPADDSIRFQRQSVDKREGLCRGAQYRF